MANTYDDDRRMDGDVFGGMLTRRVLAFVIDYAIVLLLMIPASVVLFFFSILTLGLGSISLRCCSSSSPAPISGFHCLRLVKPRLACGSWTS